MKQIEPEIKSRILSSPFVLAAFQEKWKNCLALKDFGIVISLDNKMTIIFTFADVFDYHRESFLVEIDPIQNLIEIVGSTN